MNNKDKLTEATLHLLQEQMPYRDNPDLTCLQLYVRDPDGHIQQLLDYIKFLSTAGHTFDVVVDPDYKDCCRKFEVDGDGCEQILDIKVTKERSKD